MPCSRTVGMHAIVIFLFSLIITTKDLTIPHCASLPTERVQNSSNIPAVKFLGLYFVCANASLTTELYRKQKAEVRIISNSSYRAHTEPIFKQFNILPLPSKSNSLNCNLCSVPSKAICHPPSIMFGLQMKQGELKQYLCRFVILMCL